MLKEIPETLQKEPLLDTCFKNAYTNNHKIALWKLANDSTCHVMIDIGKDFSNENFNFDNTKSGFIINPFHSNDPEKIFFINSDFYSNTFISENINIEGKEYLELSKIYKNPFEKTKNYLLNFQSDIEQMDKSSFVSLTKTALKYIDQKIFKKVVLARNSLFFSKTVINPVLLFNDLCKKYSSAFVSLVYHPKLGCWIGASPEILASIDENNIFHTMALAGTQFINSDKDLSKITWTHKEIEEQALVNRYIGNCFNKIKVREYEENGPKTIAAGNLAHLRTDFSININKNNIPSLASIMLKLLHPTSAVCGMPKEPAMDFILSNEKFDRELYSGYLGPVNIGNQSNIYVNIRCAKLYKNTAILYAGAGITKESDPEKEWLETEIKMNIIKDILLKNQ